MSDQITPALTSAEWVDVARERPLFTRHSIVGDVEYLDAADKHAAAAVALHGHPAGFTWEDVDLLRFVAECNGRDNIALHHERTDDPDGYKAIAAMYQLADRIAALLPPRESTNA